MYDVIDVTKLDEKFGTLSNEELLKEYRED
jgi:hypothetical protein